MVNADHDRSVQRQGQRPLSRHERYVYTYNLVAASTPLQFLISVEPASSKPTHGRYIFRLAFRANGIERSLGEPVELRMAVNPKQLNFVIFVFPGKTTLPTGGLWSLRVWLRVNGIDHRLFGEDELWVGKDLDFDAIADASFARLKNVDTREQMYHGFVGKALVNFIVRWQRTNHGSYKYSLDYEAGGVSATLFADLELRFDGDPRTVTFLIYTVPISSLPAGASHRLRVWLRSLVQLTSDPSTQYALPFNDSYIYQRIWKSDSFKVGARLDFESLGGKMIMAFPAVGGPETIVSVASRSPSTGGNHDKSKRSFYNQ
ncbi:hypothetical protein AMATHDRAFT_75765 [Amanita thiersii Skay4041]|uniref:Uncharacterized protein n=1 Tax=Amanita thiersii Skay4041 TaxID=703135 RepID=A0A2A9NLC4_9AGAR|nr:hypothetical protein AMATHDRAFT_75765 [Amanita thiersii Skay4041]